MGGGPRNKNKCFWHQQSYEELHFSSIVPYSSSPQSPNSPHLPFSLLCFSIYGCLCFSLPHSSVSFSISSISMCFLFLSNLGVYYTLWAVQDILFRVGDTWLRSEVAPRKRWCSVQLCLCSAGQAAKNKGTVIFLLVLSVDFFEIYIYIFLRQTNWNKCAPDISVT